NATVARWRPALILVFRAVDVNETVPGVRVLFVTPIQPENSGHDQILSRRKRIFRSERHPTSENRSARHLASDLLRDAKIAGGRLETAFLSPNTETRAGDRI